ncbi:MAG: hypothetical protein NXI19_03585 [Alphaproteobacteria bacterium]|nr:hypothetical protein [Alphaproteobacteria bacterium]
MTQHNTDAATVPPMWLTHHPRMVNTDTASDEAVHAARLDEIEKRLQQEIDDDYAAFIPENQ